MSTYSEEFPYIFSKEREELILADMEKTKEEIMATQGIRKLSNRKQLDFTSQFCHWLEKRGANPLRINFYEYEIDSIFGPLRLFLPDSQMYGYEVYGRFLEPINDSRANSFYINPHSGKWNHSIHDVDMPVDEAIAQMINWIEPVLIKEQGNG